MTSDDTIWFKAKPDANGNKLHRLVDERIHMSNRNPDGSRRVFSGYPGATVAHLNVVSTSNTAAAGFATLWDEGDMPGISQLNYKAGQDDNMIIPAPLAADGSFLIYPSTETQFVIDILGIVVGDWVAPPVVVPPPPAPPPPVTPPVTGFNTKDGFITLDSKPWQPFGTSGGAAINGSWIYTSFDGKGLLGGAQITKDKWGFNLVRLVVQMNNQFSPQQWATYCSKIIDEYTALKIVVQIECHELTGGDVTYEDQRYNNIRAFYDILLAKYGANDYVWWEIVNEAFTWTGGAWADVGTKWYNHVRQFSDSMFVWDCDTWGQGVKNLAQLGQSFLAGKHKVVFTHHAYTDLQPGEFEPIAKQLIALGIPYYHGEFCAMYDKTANQDNPNQFTYPKMIASINAVTDPTYNAKYMRGAVHWDGTGTGSKTGLHQRVGDTYWAGQGAALAETAVKLLTLTGKPQAGV